MAYTDHNEDAKPRLKALQPFIIAVVWAAVAFRVSTRLIVLSSQYSLLIRSVVLLVLLAVGFVFLSTIFERRDGALRNLGLVRRKSVGAEWAAGLAIGWGAVVVLVLPGMLVGRVHPAFDWSATAWNSLFANLAMLAAATLAQELAFRGYPFQRLIEAAGETKATLMMALLVGLLYTQAPFATATSTIVAMVGAVLFGIANLRTRALWMPWGLHFGWAVSMALIFGLPYAGMGPIGAVVQSQAEAPEWLTGGAYGPEASLLALLVMIAAVGVVVTVTRDWAWEYTFQPVEGAGYAMDVPPPSEHAKMEAEAKPAPLVQIASSTPQGFSRTDLPPRS